MKVIIYFLVLVSFCYNSTLFGQSAKDDLERSETLYRNIQGLYLEMSNTVYQNGEKTISQSGIIRKSGEQYLYELNAATMLVNEKYIITINKRSYSIIVDKWSKNKAAKLANTKVPKAKDLLKNYSDISYKGEKNGFKHYTFENKSRQVSKIEMFFNQKTGFAEKTIYHHNPLLVKDEVKIELILKNIKVNPSFPADTFSEKKLIKIEGEKITPSPKYSNYSVHKLQDI